ncbi:MAG: protein kinase [Planctomycetes bacterium]|nr:protein kinase [Planctomycetota bacterium]
MPHPQDARLAHWLLERGRATEESLRHFRAEQTRRGGVPLAQLAFEQNLLSPQELTHWARPLPADSVLPSTSGAGAPPQAPKPPAGDDERDPIAGRPLGPYVLKRELGRGGMGVVYEAHDPDLQRPVAIKQLLRQEGASAQLLAKRRERFLREGRAVAKLEHPNVVPVLRVSEHEGQPYMVMGFVEGGDLEELLERETLTVREVALLFVQIANALGHAHAHGIVHRDVKPANVLVGADRRAYLTDFGLARDLESESNLSRTGAIMGTPHYLNPEQAKGEHSQVCPASDVFSLGAVLYHCLTESLPFEGQSLGMIAGAVVHSEPTPPREVRPQIPRDMETLILKCLEKDPQRRYADGAEVAAELQRFLDGEVIEARPITRRERWARWARRNKLLAATSTLAIAAILALLCVGVAAGAYKVQLLREERDLADEKRDLAESRRLKAVEDQERDARLVFEAQAAREDALQAGRRERAARQRVEEESRAKDIQLAHALREKGERYARDLDHGRAAALFAASLETVATAEARSGLLRARLRLRPQVGAPWPERVIGLALHGSQPVVASTRAGVTTLAPYGAPGRRGVRPFATESRGGAWALAVDSARKRVAFGDLGGNLRVGSLADSQTLAEVKAAHASPVTGLAFTSDGRLISCGLDGNLQEWSLREGGLRRGLVRELKGERPLALAVHEGTLACVTDRGRLHVWKGEDEAPSLSLEAHKGWSRALSAGPEGRWLTAGFDGYARVWDAKGQRLHELRVGEALTAACWLGETQVVVGTARGATEVWDLETGQRREQHQDHDAPVFALKATTLPAAPPQSPTPSAMVVSGGWDGVVVVRRSVGGRSLLSGENLGSPLRGLALDAAGGRLFGVDTSGLLSAFDLSSERPRQIYRVTRSPCERVILDAKRGLAYVGGRAPFLFVVDLATKRFTGRPGHKAANLGLSLASDGALISADARGRLCRWEPGKRQAVSSREFGSALRHVLQSPDGTRLAAVLADRLEVWEGSRLVGRLAGCTGRPAFVPGSKALLVPRRRALVLWDPAGGPPRGLGEEGALIRGVRVSHSGQRALVVREDGLGTLWDLARLRPVERWPCASEASPDAGAVSPGGERAALIGPDGSARVWETAPRDLRPALSCPEGVTLTSNLVRAKARIVAACSDGAVRGWDLDGGSPPRAPTDIAPGGPPPGDGRRTLAFRLGWLAALPSRARAPSRRAAQLGRAPIDHGLRGRAPAPLPRLSAR